MYVTFLWPTAIVTRLVVAEAFSDLQSLSLILSISLAQINEAFYSDYYY